MPMGCDAVHRLIGPLETALPRILFACVDCGDTFDPPPTLRVDKSDAVALDPDRCPHPLGGQILEQKGTTCILCGLCQVQPRLGMGGRIRK